jgi:hypothetical protein
MNHKTKILVDRFVGIISAWPGVDCITLNEAALADILDPYYALILDVFCSSSIPDAEERHCLYGNDVAAFESSGQNVKDRFLIGNIPVRLEYKYTGKIEELISIADSKPESLWLIKDAGTYGFYRLTNGDIIFSRNNWIHAIRRRLNNLPVQYWTEMRAAAQSKMEHFLLDLGAASFQKDNFHYLISSSGFIKTACLTLFCINRCFEPSHRAYFKQTLELAVLPDTFKAEFEVFLGNEPDINMERRFTLATVIAKGIIALPL